MGTRPAHFISDPDGMFHPTENARSRWGDDMLNGPAVVSLAAFNLEQRFGLPEFLPARLTVDLFKAARRVPTTVRSRLIRDGRRIRNSECDVMQGDVIVARATLVQYRLSEPPPGDEWFAHAEFTPPSDCEQHGFFIGSDDVGWRADGGAHQNTSRKRVYHSPIDVVAGHDITPFVRTVVVAEATSLVSNLGTKGIGYINGDLTVALSRLPESEHIGVQGDSHWVSDGISVGTGTLFDSVGPFGTGLVTAIANPAAQIDFSAPDSIPTLSV
ncbi:thioesterase family protein [Mycobacterium crocinum]|uniref:Thioesterase family protein n=1 Tax=Mycolicibacterium crocinum TaxID=388459 RepID=A0ABY3TIZ7_9MYCO|nr:acyl-CoA thioesterase domain-containing protein [Mycolicibacterium crocinum]MCV7218646.1 thioesterase family protein [Mycolicibacterium crocinum]ULN39208.1 thioesterase family protein [Mycolicibacterium crocinum]